MEPGYYESPQSIVNALVEEFKKRYGKENLRIRFLYMEFANKFNVQLAGGKVTFGKDLMKLLEFFSVNIQVVASLIHPASCEGLKSKLDLFALPATQTLVDHGRVVEHRPTSILSENSPVEFVISEEGDYYIDLANTFLHVRAAVVNKDGSNIAENANTAPITDFLHSLWSRVDLSLNSIEQYLCISSVYRDAVELWKRGKAVPTPRQ